MIENIELIQRIQSGQRDLIDILIDKYKNPFYKFCYHLTSNRYDADDLFQETWMKVVKNINLCNKDKQFEPWLYSIALNLYKDKYRKSKRWLNRIKEYFDTEVKDHEIELIDSGEPLPEDKLLYNEQKDQLKECINKLDDSFRIPIILFYFRELSYDDISEILALPLGTVKSRLSSGRKKLMKLMEEDKNG